MKEYDKAIEVLLNPHIATICKPRELRALGKVMIINALLKDGITVDDKTKVYVVDGMDSDGNVSVRVRAVRVSKEN